MADHGRSGPVRRSLSILELVAERGGVGARELSVALGLPLPTVYRLVRDLVDDDYLVHLRSAGRYELGSKLHRLGLALHHQVGLSAAVRQEIVRLHESTGLAAYLAVVRGGELVVVHVVDSPECPRLTPLRFGFHEAPHATAFGKILLAGLDPEGRDLLLARHGLRALTARTITERAALDAELAKVARHGLAAEHEEFSPGWSCLAVPVRGADTVLVGAVAVSAPAERLAQLPGDREPALAARLRQVASRVGAALRGGSV